MEAIKVVQVGLGPLGRKMVQFMKVRKGLEVVGAVDNNPELIGKDLGELCNLGPSGIKIAGSIREVATHAKIDVALLTTVSDMKRISSQLEAIVAQGIPVVSTCEELSYPWETAPDLAKKIDQAARTHKVAVLGTGVNPGYLMDALPIFLTAVCQNVKKIKVSRYQNAEFRRIPFQKKIGAGLTLQQFEAKKKEGTLRHVGLTESIQMIAGRMGWKLDKTEDILSPVIATKDIVTKAMTIKAGDAAGVQQTGRGYVKGKEVITLDFKAWVGEPEPRDCIEIEGEPNIKSVIAGGVNGDIATCAITINAIKQILRVSPGLKTMADVPEVSFFS